MQDVIEIMREALYDKFGGLDDVGLGCIDFRATGKCTPFCCKLPILVLASAVPFAGKSTFFCSPGESVPAFSSMVIGLVHSSSAPRRAGPSSQPWRWFPALLRCCRPAVLQVPICPSIRNMVCGPRVEPSIIHERLINIHMTKGQRPNTKEANTHTTKDAWLRL